MQTGAIGATGAKGAGAKGAGAKGAMPMHPSHLLHPLHPLHPFHLDSYKYVGFEDQFGARSVRFVSASRRKYRLRGCDDVLDVGCGRGEFSSCSASGHFRARDRFSRRDGRRCASAGLDATAGDVLSYRWPSPTARSAGCLPRRSSSTWSRIT